MALRLALAITTSVSRSEEPAGGQKLTIASLRPNSTAVSLS